MRSVKLFIYTQVIRSALWNPFYVFKFPFYLSGCVQHSAFPVFHAAFTLQVRVSTLFQSTLRWQNLQHSILPDA